MKGGKIDKEDLLNPNDASLELPQKENPNDASLELPQKPKKERKGVRKTKAIKKVKVVKPKIVKPKVVKEKKPKVVV
jgi:hypothetical protein